MSDVGGLPGGEAVEAGGAAAGNTRTGRNPVKLGLVGYGYWGEYVARAIARVADLNVIADPNPERQAAAREHWGPWGTTVASEPEVAFARCDAVWVAAPVVDHARLVGSALADGCHVLCEKPFVGPEEAIETAETLTQMAADADRALMVGHLSLHTGQHQYARQVHLPAQANVVRRNTRASISDGSVLWGIGPHDIAALVDLWGEVETVHCHGTRHAVRCELEWPDNGPTATVELDWLAETRHRSFQLRGMELANHPNKVEPLLLEARTFVALCGGGKGRERKRKEAVEVTSTLARLETARLNMQVAA